MAPTSSPDPTRSNDQKNWATTWRWRAYGALVVTLSVLHYGLLSRFSNSDEGGLAWFRRRLDPSLPVTDGRPRVWIHAVSAGESKVAEVLRASLLQRAPDLSVVLSATTYSGFARVQQIAGAAQSFIMPLDTAKAQKRVIDTVRPDVLVVVESEFWPAQFTAARQAGAPAVVVNATMSERSFRRHGKHPAVASRTLRTARRIFAQDVETRDRYRALGVPEDRLALSGNLKMAAARALDGRGRPPLVVFGNLHRDELPVLAPALRALAESGVVVRVVPRYPGRIPQAEIATALGERTRIVADPAELTPDIRLGWIDRMGVLAGHYESASVGVVCGTFCDVGGHDLSEPLQRGAASVFGPRTERQRLLRAELSAREAALEVTDAAVLADEVRALLADEPRRLAMLDRFSGLADEARARLAEISDEIIALGRD